jgi:hypothetical protein
MSFVPRQMCVEDLGGSRSWFIHVAARRHAAFLQRPAF